MGTAVGEALAASVNLPVCFESEFSVRISEGLGEFVGEVAGGVMSSVGEKPGGGFDADSVVFFTRTVGGFFCEAIRGLSAEALIFGEDSVGICWCCGPGYCAGLAPYGPGLTPCGSL